jgi:hypothetical protein
MGDFRLRMTTVAAVVTLVPVLVCGCGLGVQAPTRTPRPVDTVTPPATETPASTRTALPFPTPTDTPIPTLTPTDTPSPTSLPSPVPTQPDGITRPQLTAPPLGQTFESPITFEWEGSLAAEQAYRVTAYLAGTDYVIESDLLTVPTWSVDIPLDYIGEWRWSVSVIQGDQVIATSDEWMFWLFGYGCFPSPTPEGPMPPPPG